MEESADVPFEPLLEVFDDLCDKKRSRFSMLVLRQISKVNTSFGEHLALPQTQAVG